MVWFDVAKTFSKYDRIHHDLSKDGFSKSDQHIKEQLHYTKYEYSHAQNFTKYIKSDNSLAKAFSNENNDNLPERCNHFFNYLNSADPEFRFEQFNEDHDVYDKGIVKKEAFFKNEYAKLIKDNKLDKDKAIFSKKDNDTINKKFINKIKQTLITDQHMADTTTLMRIYGHCFIHDHGEKLLQFENNKRHYDKFTEKLFYHFSGNLPLFISNLTDTKVSTGYPIYTKNNKFEGEYHKYDKDKDNIIDFIHEKSTGKGIVISATTRYTKDIIKLIRVLRASNNELPIQIIYKNDLNQRSQKYIMAAATADYDELFSISMSPDVNLVLPELDIIESSKKYGSTFPKQDIMFVNILPTVKKNYKYTFTGYNNKVLALLFSSFKEIILLDADSVPLISPIDFFHQEQYQKSGSFFFKDRTLRDTNDYIETNYFTKLMPFSSSSIDSYFGVKPITEKTLNNAYMMGWRHFQEAGVVVINKHDHFLGILMTIPLALWNDPVKSSIWGDKEMYWLGLSMAGDENYEFNTNEAASIGEVTTDSSRKNYLGTLANEVCSSHPGHIDDSGNLLWINSGFSFCKKNGYFRDKSQFPLSTFENLNLQKLYTNPLKIRNAIVPPNLPKFRDPGSPIDSTEERKFMKSWSNREKDIDEINSNLKIGDIKIDQITAYNPQKGWIKSGICSSYNYCAYDKIDSYDDYLNDDATKVKKLDDSGKLFTFDDKETEYFDYLGKIWVTGNSRSLPPSKEQKKIDQEIERKQKEAQQKKQKQKEEQDLYDSLHENKGPLFDENDNDVTQQKRPQVVKLDVDKLIPGKDEQDYGIGI